MSEKNEKFNLVISKGAAKRYEENIRSLIDKDAVPRNTKGEFARKPR